MRGTAVTLAREVLAIQIPLGEKVRLPTGTPVVLTQSLGGTFTVEAPSLGGLYRIAGADADALGLERPEGASPAPAQKAAAGGEATEDAVYAELRTVYDPEIPVNIVDLGLVYDLKLDPLPSGKKKATVKMTLTAPGCGMGPAIAADARDKVSKVPGIEEANVELVWDPPWSWEMMSPEGKKKLGL
jgi:probable FeS assembly SUF system protein SufT